MTRPDPDLVAALTEERDFLLRSLDDLDREAAAGDLDPDDHAALYADYTARAASVIRRLESEEADLVDAQRAAAVSPWRRVAVATAVVVVLAGVGWAVAASSGERAVGDVVTGNIRQSSNDQLARARLALSSGDLAGAIARYDDVLSADPSNREALAYKGWLLVLASSGEGAGDLLDVGIELIDDAVAADPDYADARFFRSFVRYRHLDDPAGALDDARAFMAADPPPSMVPDVVALIDELTEVLGIEPVAGSDDGSNGEPQPDDPGGGR